MSAAARPHDVDCSDEDRPDDVGQLMTELHETAAAVRARGEAIARAVGQSQARWQVLFTLAQGRMTVPHLARRLGHTRQSVQRVIDLLAHDGLVSGAPNPAHRRSSLFELTHAGRRTLDRINGTARGWHGAVRAGLAPTERTRLRRALATVRALALDAEVEGSASTPSSAPAAGTVAPAPSGRRPAGAHR